MTTRLQVTCQAAVLSAELIGNPQNRGKPNMPESLEQLDLLLLTVPRTRRVRPDGIRCMGMRYIDPTLAAYVGEEVLLRYDPRDVG